MVKSMTFFFWFCNNTLYWITSMRLGLFLKWNHWIGEIPTWPPVSGNPRTAAWPKYPRIQRITMLNIFGSLLKSDSNFTRPADSSTSESNFIVSLTFHAVLPQPLSNPYSLNLQTIIQIVNYENSFPLFIWFLRQTEEKSKK